MRVKTLSVSFTTVTPSALNKQMLNEGRNEGRGVCSPRFIVSPGPGLRDHFCPGISQSEKSVGAFL